MLIITLHVRFFETETSNITLTRYVHCMDFYPVRGESQFSTAMLDDDFTVSVSLPVISTDEGLNLKLRHETSLIRGGY